MELLMGLMFLGAFIVIVAVGFFLVLLFVLAMSVVFGSSIDPDDNGLLKSAEAREAWRQEKLKALNERTPNDY